MRFNEIITNFRNNKPLPEVKFTGGNSDINIFKNYLTDKRKQLGVYMTIYIVVLVLLILLCVVTVFLKDNLSASFKYVIGGEGVGVGVFVGLLNGVVKVQQNALDLLFLIGYFAKQPAEQKKVLDAFIDDLKARRKFFK